MSSRTIQGAAVGATLIAIAAYWYWSPLLAVRQMQTAARDGDADAFSAHVDFPRVRASLKGQFATMFDDQLARVGNADNVLARVGAAFGARLGEVIVDRFLDQAVQPDTIMRAMQQGRLLAWRKPPASAPAPADDIGARDSAGAAPPPDAKVYWDYQRVGVNQVVATATLAHQLSSADKSTFSLVLQRSGFADWKLTEIRLPAVDK